MSKLSSGLGAINQTGKALLKVALWTSSLKVLAFSSRLSAISHWLSGFGAELFISFINLSKWSDTQFVMFSFLSFSFSEFNLLNFQFSSRYIKSVNPTLSRILYSDPIERIISDISDGVCIWFSRIPRRMRDASDSLLTKLRFLHILDCRHIGHTLFWIESHWLLDSHQCLIQS